MPQGVRQPLLHEPVRREVQTRRQVCAAPVTESATGSPAVRNFSASRSTWSSPGGGSSSVAVAGLAQHPDHPAHLGEGLPPDGLNGLQRLALDRLLGREPAPHRGRLHRHDADAVADHVVQLAGDPVALLGHGL